MSDAAKKALHDLVDGLPVDQIDRARRALERVTSTSEIGAAVNQRDIDIINAHLDELNAEAEDVLGYQAEW